MLELNKKLRRAVTTKAPLRVHFLLKFWGEEQEASALLNKKGGMEGSIENQQKFDILKYDIKPKKPLFFPSIIDP